MGQVIGRTVKERIEQVMSVQREKLQSASSFVAFVGWGFCGAVGGGGGGGVLIGEAFVVAGI